mmetsp:Transcript_106115/g.307021  ORF Transcript_106115/g.307021 Transcript_106115/m.307021 type:complete len:206 (+) Transcript_106115:215-832(+)
MATVTATYMLETRTQIVTPTVVRRTARHGSSAAACLSSSPLPCGGAAECHAEGGHSSGSWPARAGRHRSASLAFASSGAAASTTAAMPAVEAAAAVGHADARSNAGLLPDSTTMNLLHCLFAMAFAAITLGGLAFVGVTVKTSSSVCPAEPGYTLCAAWQDFRSIGSFVLGALLCCLFSQGKEANLAQVALAEPAEKIQLYAYML